MSRARSVFSWPLRHVSPSLYSSIEHSSSASSPITRPFFQSPLGRSNATAATFNPSSPSTTISSRPPLLSRNPYFQNASHSIATRLGTIPLSSPMPIFFRGYSTPSELVAKSWLRSIHTGRHTGPMIVIRCKSSRSTTDKDIAASHRQDHSPSNKSDLLKPDSHSRPSSEGPSETSTSKYFHLPQLPHLPHRPTKEDFLSAANGFWERLKVRFKWVSIRSMRPWNIDEWGAFVSWFLFGHLLWILAGTTTFFSLVILSINTVFAQGKIYFYLFLITISVLTRRQRPLRSG